MPPTTVKPALGTRIREPQAFSLPKSYLFSPSVIFGRLDPKNAAAWSCVSWLHLLLGSADLALPAAQRSIKLDHRNPQAHVNLALALLGTGGKGVRKHIELVQKVMDFSEEVRADIHDNIADGLKRKPDWQELEKVKRWLSE